MFGHPTAFTCQLFPGQSLNYVNLSEAVRSPSLNLTRSDRGVVC
ncbi:hypothetical protein [Oxynema aestuarii]|nr:hypothetical protein [Oxynema aestuarii]